MKHHIFALYLLLCMSTFGYSDLYRKDTLPSIENIIEQIEHSSPSERKKALSLLKQKLKGIKKTERRAMMRKLKHALQKAAPKKRNRASEILGSFSTRGGGGRGNAQGHNRGHGGSGNGGGHGGGSGGGGHGGR